MEDTIPTRLHIKFLQKCLKAAPGSFASYEPTRPTILFFIVSGLDIVNGLGELTAEEKAGICDWIYSQQIEPKAGLEQDAEELKKCGFFGSRTLISKDCDNQYLNEYNVGHLAMTSTLLCTLLILGDDLSRVNRTALLKAIKYLQNENGSFLSSVVCGESDMRFVYCAVVICYILNDFSFINVEAAVHFIVSSIRYDGGIALEPNLESHGGSSFCGIAALYLMGKLESALSDNQTKNLKRWLICRQQSGFEGRTNKEVDSCYSFWIGASLKMVDLFRCINYEENRHSILLCQDSGTGGFSKYCYSKVDLLHTYLGLYGLSLMDEPGLSEMHPALNMSMRAYRHLKKLHERRFEKTPF